MSIHSALLFFKLLLVIIYLFSFDKNIRHFLQTTVKTISSRIPYIQKEGRSRDETTPVYFNFKRNAVRYINKLHVKEHEILNKK